MGHRTLKRVPLDFNAPLDKAWKGYINPHSGPRSCKSCDGSGLNATTHQISEYFYDHEGFGTRWIYDYGVNPEGKPATRPPWRILGESRTWSNSITQDEVQALVDEGRLMDFTHTWKQGEGWKRREDGYIPTAAEVNEWSQHGFGHDAINRSILIETRAKRLGVYGNCPDCKGRGETRLPRKLKKKYNKWKEFEPPTGPGYQLWETCSEGSPISPVFASAEELADWCAKNATIFADEKMPRANWLKMFIGEEDLETGSLLVAQSDYFGSLANATK